MADHTPIAREEHEAKVQALRQALIDGENSGKPAPLDGVAFVEEMRSKYGAYSGSGT